MLEGMKVVEMASIAAGPAAAAMLAEWGAEVIKVEPLAGDPGRHSAAGLGVTGLAAEADFDLNNRGKRAIALNLGKPEAKAVVDALVARADVFVTNILSEKQVQRGLDWGRLSKINPRLVHASISGYGPTGPDSQLRSIDHTAFWARSGMAHLITPKGQEPVPIRRAMGDRVASMGLVAGILAAYVEAQRTGRGKAVETSLLRAAIYALGTDVTTQATLGRVGSNQPRPANVNPLHSFFPTKDGRWIAANLGRIENVAAFGHPELLEDPRFADPKSRRAHAPEVIEKLDSIFRERTLAEWREALREAAFTWSPVLKADEVLTDPQAQAAGALVDVPTRAGDGTFRSTAMPAGFTDADGAPEGLPRGPGPQIGQHTDEILAELGYPPQRVAALREAGVVG